MHRRMSLVVAIGVAMTAGMVSPVRAGEIHMMLFEHDVTHSYGALMLVAPSEPVADVSGLIDSDREVVFDAAANGMHVGAAWGMDSMDDVVALLAGDWRLFLDDGASNVQELNFGVDGSAVDTSSLDLPLVPTISQVRQEGSQVSMDWVNRDAETEVMLAGAVDWEDSVALATDLAYSGSTVVGDLPGGDYEMLLASLVGGPSGVITGFDEAGWADPSLWMGTMTSRPYTVSATLVPEPSSLGLLLVAAAGLAVRRRRGGGPAARVAA